MPPFSVEVQFADGKKLTLSGDVAAITVNFAAPDIPVVSPTPTREVPPSEPSLEPPTIQPPKPTKPVQRVVRTKTEAVKKLPSRPGEKLRKRKPSKAPHRKTEKPLAGAPSSLTDRVFKKAPPGPEPPPSTTPEPTVGTVLLTNFPPPPAKVAERITITGIEHLEEEIRRLWGPQVKELQRISKAPPPPREVVHQGERWPYGVYVEGSDEREFLVGWLNGPMTIPVEE